jgi:hypothetical protein
MKIKSIFPFVLFLLLCGLLFVSGGVKMYEKRRFENADKIKSYLPGSRLMPAA